MSILIITSTVNVNSNLTYLIDAKTRLKQYVDSIDYYLSSTLITKIIICDNSGFDYSDNIALIEIAKKNNKQIEFLAFHGNKTEIKNLGKGFGEGEIMSHVFSKSKLIKQEDISFFKVTGRLKILNIDKILASVKSNDNYFNRVNLNPFVNLKKVDTRFYKCSKQDFKLIFEDVYKEVNDSQGVFLEHVYYNTLIKNKIEFKSFKVLPNFSGISGSTGQEYSISKGNFILRQFVFSIFNFLNIRS